MSEITIKELTKDYGHSRGVFNVEFEVKKGEIFGFIGTNGSGKTTTIRHIMGFSRPDNGTIKVRNIDATKHSTEVKKMDRLCSGRDCISGFIYRKIIHRITSRTS